MGSKWFTGGVVSAEDMNTPSVCADDGAAHDSVSGEALYCAHPTRRRANMSGKTSTRQSRYSYLVRHAQGQQM